MTAAPPGPARASVSHREGGLVGPPRVSRYPPACQRLTISAKPPV
jgi:hypothetical protein